MLKLGDVVQLGRDKYEVVKETKLPCIECDIRNCYMDKDLDALKAKEFALSCADLKPIGTCFKKVVEQSPQVDCKLNY